MGCFRNPQAKSARAHFAAGPPPARDEKLLRFSLICNGIKRRHHRVDFESMFHKMFLTLQVNTVIGKASETNSRL